MFSEEIRVNAQSIKTSVMKRMSMGDVLNIKQV